MIMRFKKKLAAVAVALFLFIGMTAGLVLFVAVGGQGYARVSFGKDYYFLVKDGDHGRYLFRRRGGLSA